MLLLWGTASLVWRFNDSSSGKSKQKAFSLVKQGVEKDHLDFGKEKK
jgi:hypothetical protein